MGSQPERNHLGEYVLIQVFPELNGLGGLSLGPYLRERRVCLSGHRDRD